MNFRCRRSCPRVLLQDLAVIYRREKEERYGGRDDWRRLAYASILTGQGAGVGGDGDGAIEPAGGGVGFSEVCESNGCMLLFHLEWWMKSVADDTHTPHQDADATQEKHDEEMGVKDVEEDDWEAEAEEDEEGDEDEEAAEPSRRALRKSTTFCEARTPP